LQKRIILIDMSDSTDQLLRLSLRQLEIFVATARSGSTRGAADRLARSQSAASTALSELEGTLGVQLFDRVNRRLLLNENGSALLPHAVAIVEQASQAQTLFSTAHRAPLRLAASYTIGEYVLPALLADWKKQHPNSQVRLTIANTADVLRSVQAFEVDIGFVEGARTHADLLVRRWLNDEMVIVAAAKHPLGRRKLSLKQLSQVGWVLREEGSGTREAADRWLVGRIPAAKVELELGSNEAVKRAVASGLGIGCLSRHAVADALHQGWLVEVKTALPTMKRSLAIVLHRTKRLGAGTEGFLQRCMQAKDGYAQG